jgi:hypothetical protein
MAAGFIVDGMMEKLIVQKICPDAPVRRADLNGKDVTIAAMATKMAPLIRSMKNCYPVVIIFDREERAATAPQLCNTLKDELTKHGIDPASTVIAASDNMIENWILACPRFREQYEYDGVADGCNGKARVKAALRRKEEEYHGPTKGVDLFHGLDVKGAVTNSENFRQLTIVLNDHCPWIRRKLQEPGVVGA